MESITTISTSTRQSTLELVDKRDQLENELKELFQALQSNGTDMHQPLVDNEGYPRSDLDVHQVRTVRHRIICLQNDLKELTRRIEAALHDLHAQQRQGMGWSNETLINKTSLLSILKDVTEDDQPFAKIGTVQSGSPADQAGLRTDDLIVAMGTLRCSNVGHGLTDVADLVRHSVDRPIPVCIRRVDSVNNGLIELMLTPKKWPPGVGLLGCVLLPFDSIDR